MIFIFLLVLMVLSQANPLTTHIGRDGGAFAYIGQLILKGKLPYIDAWDSKPPGIFYLNAFALWLGMGTRWGIWLVEFLFLFGAATAGFQVMRKYWNPGAAIFGTTLWMLGLIRVLSGGNFTEEYSLLFNFLAILVFWKSLSEPKNKLFDIVLGLTLASSFLFRANNIGVQVSIALTLFIVCLAKKEIKLFLIKMAVWVSVTIIILGSVCLYFATKHALSALIESAIVYNFSYAGNQGNLLSGVINGFQHLGITARVALIGYIFAIIVLARSIKAKDVDVMTLFLVVGWPVEIALASMSGRPYGHYFISWLPVLALLGGLVFSFLSPKVLSTGLLKLINERTWILVACLLVIVAFLFRNELLVYSDTFSRLLINRANGIQKISLLEGYLREQSNPNDTVLVWGGQAGINFMAQRESPTPYLFYPGYVASSPISKRLANAFYTDVVDHPPLFIVDAYINDPDHTLSLDPKTRAVQLLRVEASYYHPDNQDAFFAFVGDNYNKVEELDNYVIYELLKKP